MFRLQEIDWMGDDEAPPLAEPDSNDEMPGGSERNQEPAGTTPKASPTVPPGMAVTPSNERLGVAPFVAPSLPAPEAKAAAKQKSKKKRVKKTGVKVKK